MKSRRLCRKNTCRHQLQLIAEHQAEIARLNGVIEKIVKVNLWLSERAEPGTNAERHVPNIVVPIKPISRIRRMVWFCRNLWRQLD